MRDFTTSSFLLFYMPRRQTVYGRCKGPSDSMQTAAPNLLERPLRRLWILWLIFVFFFPLLVFSIHPPQRKNKCHGDQNQKDPEDEGPKPAEHGRSGSVGEFREENADIEDEQHGSALFHGDNEAVGIPSSFEIDFGPLGRLEGGISSGAHPMEELSVHPSLLDGGGAVP